MYSPSRSSLQLPLYPTPLGLPSAPGPSTCLMHPTWAGDLFHLRVFSNESALCIMWPKCWSFSFSICPSSEYSRLTSFRSEWFVHMVLGNVLISFFSMYLFSFTITTFWRDCFSPYSCLICQRESVHKCMGLSLGSLSCFTSLYFCFCASSVVSWLQYLCTIVWSQGTWFLQLCFSFSSLLCLLRVCCVSIQMVILLLF